MHIKTSVTLTSHHGTAGSRRTKVRPHPTPIARTVVDVIMHSGGLVQFLDPTIGQGGDRDVVRTHLSRTRIATRAEVRLLGRRQAHLSGAPIVQVGLVVELFVRVPSDGWR